MINFNDIIQPIERALVGWTERYPLAVKVQNLQDLTNAEFFVLLLRRVDGFQLTETGSYGYVQVGLGERIGRMRMVGRSIARYYRCEMMKDLGEAHFNYVEMCSGNNEELMKLVILFLGVVVTNRQILEELQQYIATSEEESTGYLNIMIDYAQKMAQGEEESVESSPVKKQKRLITRLEILQEQIEFYEEYTKELEGKVEQLSEDALKYQRTIGEGTQQASEMLKRIEELQSNSQELLKEINKKTANEQLLNGKLAKNRQLADETINRLVEDIEKAKESAHYYKKCMMKYEQVQSINKELTNTNNDLSKEISQLRAKMDKCIESLHKKNIEIEQLTHTNNELNLENDGLKVKIELLEKSFTNNRSNHFSPQQKSVVMHNPLDLSSTSNQNNLMWFNFKDRDMERNESNYQMNESLTLTLKSNTSQAESRNFINAIENKENDIKNANSSNQVEFSELNDICEEKSFQLNIETINALMKIKEQRDFQMQFAIQMIAETYSYMQGLRKQLKKYQIKQARQLERALAFNQKVNRMFG